MLLRCSKLGKERRGKEHIALMDIQCCMKADLINCIPVFLATLEINFEF